MDTLDFTQEIMSTMSHNFGLMKRELDLSDPNYESILAGCKEIIKFMRFIPYFSEHDDFLKGLGKIAGGQPDKGTVYMVFFPLERFFTHFYPAQGK